MVGTDTHGGSIFFTDFNQRDKLFINPAQLGIISILCIFYIFEFLFIGVITWVYAYFLHNPCGHFGCIRGKMDVGN
ncbi:hypothetical protein D3C73_1516620 [compost metagenome]